MFYVVFFMVLKRFATVFAKIKNGFCTVGDKRKCFNISMHQL